MTDLGTRVLLVGPGSLQAKALKRALAEQLGESMQAAKLTKLDMARKMATSASRLDRVSDRGNVSVQLD